MIWATRAVVLGALAFVVGPMGLAAQLCETGTISDVRYDRLKPFGAEATSEDAKAGWLFRGMNSVHVRTMPTVIRWELLFAVGDCFDPDLLEESARSLRSLPYIYEATINPQRKGLGGRNQQRDGRAGASRRYGLWYQLLRRCRRGARRPRGCSVGG